MADGSSELDSVIRAAANTPAAAAGDEGSFEARSIDELIQADQYLASKQATRSKGRGFNLVKLSPPGSC